MVWIMVWIIIHTYRIDSCNVLGFLKKNVAPLTDPKLSYMCNDEDLKESSYYTTHYFKALAVAFLKTFFCFTHSKEDFY